MNAALRSRAAAILRAAVPLAIVTGVATILLRFPPAQYSFYPQCPIYRYLHIQCPGCGTTRALAALLHGHVVEALRFNALTTLLMPFAAAYAVWAYYRFLRRKPLPVLQPAPSVLYIALTIAAIFTIVRNIGHI